MRSYVVTALLAVSCAEEPPVAPSEDTPFPDAIAQSAFRPVSETFGYDPDLAEAVYGRRYRFVNLDPQAFPEGPDGDAARRGIARLLTHATSDLTLPLWARVLAGESVGPPGDQLARLGFLPSPFAQHLEGSVTLPTVTGTIEVPYAGSLSESRYIYDEGEEGEREYVSNNCMVCHGGVYGDQVIAGAPNKDAHHWNVQRELLRHPDLVALERFLVRPDTSRDIVQARFSTWLEEQGQEPADIAVADAELGILNATSRYIRDIGLSVYTDDTMQTVGAQSSTFGVYSSMASLEPDGATMDSWLGPELESGKSPLFEQMIDIAEEQNGGELYFPVHITRAWWQARYSGAHFTQRWGPAGPDGSDELLAMALGTPNFGNHHQPVWSDRVDISWDMQRYMELIESPPYPEPIDWELAERGLTVYGGTCGMCHGNLQLIEGDALSADARLRLDYDMGVHEDGSGSWVPIDEVGVDTAYTDMLRALEPMRMNLRSNQEWQATGGIVDPPSGEGQRFVEAPPLVGVWATAPFMHNGSVPSVRLMLDSMARPEVWRLDADPHAYDHDALGVAWTAGSVVPRESRTDDDWRVYDTTNAAHGMTAVGHTFGDALSDSDRDAVIELLKALGTWNVEPNPTNGPWD